MWFLGAALLVAGNVIIGRREEQEGGKSVVADEEGTQQEGLLGDGGVYRDEQEEGVELRDSVDLLEAERLSALKRERDDVPHLDRS
jgi:hypothetical protein